MFIVIYTQTMQTGRQDYALKLYFILCCYILKMFFLLCGGLISSICWNYSFAAPVSSPVLIIMLKLAPIVHEILNILWQTEDEDHQICSYFRITVICQISTGNLFFCHMKVSFADSYGQECRNTGSVNSDLHRSKPGYLSISLPSCGVSLKLGLSSGLFKQ